MRNRFGVFIAMAVMTWLACGSARGQLEKAEELLAKNEINAALTEFFRLTETDPPEARACIRVAQIMLMANEIEQAQAYARLAVKADPDSARAALLIMGEAHRRAGELELAAGVYAQLGNATRASLYASFEGLTPYEIVGEAMRTELAFAESEPIPLVSIRIDGGEPILCAIDTTEAELVLNTGPALELGIETFGQLELETARGGSIVRAMGRADSISLGDFEVKNVPISVGSTKAKSDLFENRRVDGIIGTLLLSRFRFTLDYPAQRLVLERRSTRRPTIDGEAVTRFMVAGDRHLVSLGDVNRRGPFFWTIQFGTPGMAFAPSMHIMGVLDPDWTEGDRQVRQVRLGRVIKPDTLAMPGAFSETLATTFGFTIHGAVADDLLRDHAITFDFDQMEMITRKTPAPGDE